MDDRNSRYGQRDNYGRSSPQDYSRDYGSGRDYNYSSARDYAAAGELGAGRRERGGYGANRDHRGDDDWNDRDGQRGWDRDRSDYLRGGLTGQRNFGGGSYERDRDQPQPRNYDRDRGHDRDRHARGSYDQDRGFFDRAGDEVRSWFGDEEAERRRERDQRYDEQAGRSERNRDASGRGDDHYHSWRRQRIAELDRDYDEYQRENSQRFHNEFTNWRTERQSQRDSLRQVNEHMEVVGLDGSHVGTVDKVRGDRIILTKNDAEAGGHHHSIPSRWIQSVDDKVTLRKTADEAKSHWKDEERSGAMFGADRHGSDRARSDDQDWRTEGNLNRSFSGTY